MMLYNVDIFTLTYISSYLGMCSIPTCCGLTQQEISTTQPFTHSSPSQWDGGEN